MVMEAERKLLESGLIQMDLDLPEEKVDLLIQYLVLFEKWNRAFNLSAIRDPMAMVNLHLLDSLSIVKHLEGKEFADIGTGGGLPGIPLAIVFPEYRFVLLDSAGKKTRFLFQVKQTLKLSNVEIENCRVQAYKPKKLFDGVISRAFASLQDMTSQCAHLLKPEGTFWAMKGQVPEDELKMVASSHQVESCHRLKIPNVDAQRCLLAIKPL